MLRRLLIALGLALCAAASASAATDAAGPSFDCSRASGEIERAICADPQLAAADRTMGELFAALRTSAFGEGPSNYVKSQRAWLKERAACAPLDKEIYSSVTECLLSRYESRNITLAQSAIFAAPELALRRCASATQTPPACSKRWRSMSTILPKRQEAHRPPRSGIRRLAARRTLRRGYPRRRLAYRPLATCFSRTRISRKA